MKVKYIAFLIFASLLFFLQDVYGHGGGSHGHAPLNEQEAIISATEHIALIIKHKIPIEDGEVNSSWKKIPETNKSVSVKGDGYYIIAIEHPGQDKTLYLLITAYGELYDANFSGNFEGVNE